MSKATPISIKDALSRVSFLRNRKPSTTSEEAADAFTILAQYRDGDIFAGHYAGDSEWERHSNGDEIVLIVEGQTTLILLSNEEETKHLLRKGELLVVPQNTWHRFETPVGVKILTVTPQPTDHSIERPLTKP